MAPGMQSKVGSAGGAGQECRSDCCDVGGEGPPDALLTQPREPCQSRQQSISYAQRRDSFDATQALQHLGRLLHAPGEWTSTLVIPHQCIHHRGCPGEFLG